MDDAEAEIRDAHARGDLAGAIEVALCRYEGEAARHRGLSAALAQPVVDRPRTRPYMRTDVKAQFATLRESLTPDDQTLLVLRVDREMSWEDVARVLHDGELGADGLRRHAASLRQRFQRVKDRLRERAIAEGLLGHDDDGR